MKFRFLCRNSFIIKQPSLPVEVIIRSRIVLTFKFFDQSVWPPSVPGLTARFCVIQINYSLFDCIKILRG